MLVGGREGGTGKSKYLEKEGRVVRRMEGSTEAEAGRCKNN